MNRIDPQTLYTTAELRELLAGHVSIPTLRRFGLKGLSGGYFGANVLSALETYTRDRLVPGPAPRKGAGNAIFDKTQEADPNPDRPLHLYASEEFLDGKASGNEAQVHSFRTFPIFSRSDGEEELLGIEGSSGGT